MDRPGSGDGDAICWDAAYRRTHARLLAYARHRLATADQAADAVAEAFARAYGRRHLVHGGEPGVDGWLFGVLRNVVREMHRTRARDRDRGWSSWASVATDEPDARLVATEDCASLRAAFGRLSPADQRVLILRVVERLTAEEVAVRLGKRPGAVRMAQTRALARL